jgi:4a-hydroxytetrahydrobiopterin dehydratase
MNSGWNRVQASGGDVLVKQFDRGDFKGSVAFLNAILPLAEGANHHPDVEISWKTVTITLTTHSEGGVTDKDFALAEEIDAVSSDISA